MRRTLLLLALLGLLGACRGEPTPPSRSTASASARPTVPAPAGLLGELRIARPEPTWLALRAAVGGPLQYLPHGAAGMLLSVLGLPVSAAGEIDVERPLIGVGALAAAAPAGASPELAFALSLRDGRRFVGRLTQGPDATHTVETVAGSEVSYLARRRGGDPSSWLRGFELGVLDDTLLAGSSRAALARLGPYVAWTLGPRPAEPWHTVVPAPAAPAAGPATEPQIVLVLSGPELGAALSSALGLGFDALDKTKLARLRALGDPGELRATATGLLGGVAELRLGLTLDNASATLDARIRFRDEAREPWRGRGTVAPSRLLELAPDSVLGASWAESREARLGSASAAAHQVALLLGPKGPADVEPVLRDGLGEIGRGRADELVAGVRCSGVGPTGFARSALEDPKLVRHGLEQLFTLKRNPTTVARLAELGLRLGVRPTRVAELPLDVSAVRLGQVAHKPVEPEAAGSEPTAPPPPEPVELLAAVDEHALWLSAGMDARDTLSLFYRARDGAVTPETTFVAEAVGKLGPQAWLALSLRPLGLLGCGTATAESEPGALLVAGIGPAGGEPGAEAWMRAEATTALLRAAAGR